MGALFLWAAIRQAEQALLYKRFHAFATSRRQVHWPQDAKKAMIHARFCTVGRSGR